MKNCSTPIHRRNFLLRFQARQEYALPVLLKEPAHTLPSPTQIQELHNEFGINNQLSDMLGVRPVTAKAWWQFGSR